MKSFILMATLVLSTLAQAAFPIEGSWGARQFDNGFTLDMTFTFENNAVTLTNTCSFRGSVASATVKVPAAYDHANLSITSSAANTGKSADGQLTCDVNIAPMNLTYVVQGNFLTFTMPGSPEQIVLQRK